MLTNIIFAAIYIFQLACFAFSYSFDWKMKTNGNKPFMVAIPSWQADNREVLDILDAYRKRIRRFLWGMAALAVSLFLPINFMIKIVWLFLCLIPLLCIPSYMGKQSRQKLLDLKRKNGWVIETVSQRKVDLSLKRSRSNRAMLPLPLYLIPAGISCFCIWYGFIHMREASSYAIFSVVSLLVGILGYVFIRRLPQKTYCSDSGINQAVNRHARYTLSVLLFLLLMTDSTLMACMLPFFQKGTKSSYSILILALLILLFLLLFMWFTITGYQNRKKELLREQQVYLYDEDTYWHFGLFGIYYDNPYDPCLLKSNNSGGMNLNVNRAHPASKFFWILSLGIPLAICLWFLGVPWYAARIHQLMDMQVTSSSLEIASISYHRSIPLSQIQSVETTEDLGRARRLSGTYTGTYGTGSYELEFLGKAQICVTWKQPLYLVVDTPDQVYVFNEDTPQETQALWKKLQQQIPTGGNSNDH